MVNTGKQQCVPLKAVQAPDASQTCFKWAAEVPRELHSSFRFLSLAFCTTDVFLQDQKNCNIQVELKPFKAPKKSPLSCHSGPRCCAGVRHASQNATAAEAVKGKRFRGRKPDFCRRFPQLYLNRFFKIILFSSLPNPRDGGNSKNEGEQSHPVNRKCKRGCLNNRRVCLEGGCGKKTKWGEGAGGEEGLYLHHSQKTERMRSEANQFIFRADGGNEQCCNAIFFLLSCLEPQPKGECSSAPFPTQGKGLRWPCRVSQMRHKHQEDQF